MSVKPLMRVDADAVLALEHGVTAIASCGSTFCAITDTRSKTSRTSSTPVRVGEQIVEHQQVVGALAQRRRAARFVRHPLVRHRQRHVVGDAPRDVDVGFA